MVPDTRINGNEDEFEKSFNLKDILEVSISEMLIIQNLMVNPNIKRNILHENISFMYGNIQENSDLIPTSSFYQKMDKLEKKGLIARSENNKGRSGTYYATPLAMKFIDFLLKINVFGSMSYFPKILEMVPQLMQIMGLQESPQSLENVLIIICYPETIDHKFANFMVPYASSTFILADDTNFQRYLNRGMLPEVQQTKVFDGKIREAENFYDNIIIIGYKREYVLYGQPVNEWLKEAYRVLAPGGMYVIGTFSEWPHTHHKVLDDFLAKLSDNEFVAMVSEEKLLGDIIQAGLGTPRIMNLEGILAAWGRKKD